MYAVVELQKTDDTSLLYLVETFPTINQAYSKYHTILAAAAVSSIPIHSAIVLSDVGDVLASEHFEH